MGSFILMAAVAIGGVGIFLALPKGRANAARAGLVVLCAAAALFVTFLASQGGASHAAAAAGGAAAGGALAGNGALGERGGPGGWFVALSVIALAAAVRVITHTRAVYSALYLVLVIVAVAGLLVLMQAEFLAAALMVIYAGAILVTYVFVIMLAQQSGEGGYDREAREPLAATLAGFVLLGIIGAKLFDGRGAALTAAQGQADAAMRAVEAAGNTTLVGTSLLTRYAVGVELAGVLLLAAMIGAIVIARRKPEAMEREGSE